MTGELKGKRASIRAALTAANIAAFSAAPENAVPPLVFVTQNEPYISPGTMFGGLVARHQITAVVGPGVNEDTADELDDLLERVLAIIPAHVDGFEVGRPGSINLGGIECIAVAVLTETEIRLENS